MHSWYIFCEYMSILDDKLKETGAGFELFGVPWNALFYADDVL